MGDVFGVFKRTYYGLDADKANQVGLTGERYQATDTGIVYKWDGTRWRGGYEYIPRLVTTYDFDKTSFTTDGTWKVNGLDLSAIVPAGAKAVHLLLEIADDAADSFFSLRRDAVNVGNKITVTTQVANIYNMQHAFLNVDTDRKFDYAGSNLTFSAIFVYVLGWYI